MLDSQEKEFLHVSIFLDIWKLEVCYATFTRKRIFTCFNFPRYLEVYLVSAF